MGIRTRLVLCVLLVASIAGCAGTADDDGVATAGGGTSQPSSSASAEPQDKREGALKFAKCMRENGVPDFPDPEFGDEGQLQLGLPDAADSSEMGAAMEKCKEHLPGGGEPQPVDPEDRARALKFSQCMRENGVPNFPDPDDDGIKIERDKLGVDPNGPEMRAAEEICRKHLPPRSGAVEQGVTDGSDT